MRGPRRFIAALDALVLGPLRRERIRSTLTLVGVSLGIAVLVAVRLASGSALRSFRDTVIGLAGRAELEIRGAAGPIDERITRTAAALPAVAAAAPVLERGAILRGEPDQAVTVLGVDLLADAALRDYSILTMGGAEAGSGDAALRALTQANAALVPAPLATRRGLRDGDSFRLLVNDRERTFLVAGILRLEGPFASAASNLVVLDIAAAQAAFAAPGVVDRVDLALRSNAPRPLVVEEIRRALPAGLVVEPPAARGEQVERLLRAYRINLAALGFLSIVVGAFLVYNAVSVSVVRRRPAIATVRALGLSRSLVAAAFLAEGIAMGIVGSIAGTGLGIVLARGILGTVTRTIGYHYVQARVSDIAVDGSTVAMALVLGLLLSAAAGLAPALDAARVPPSRAMRRGALEVARKGVGRLAAVGALLLGVSAVAALGPQWEGIPVSGYASATLLIAGAVLLAPGLLVVLSRFAHRPAGRLLGAEGEVAAAGLVAAPGRTAVAACGLLVGLAMTVGVGTLVGSFRRTVDRWIGQTVRADLWVAPLAGASGTRGATMDREVVETLSRVEGVVDVDPFVSTPVELPRGPTISLVAGDFRVAIRRVDIPFLRGEGNEILERSARDGLAILSEVLSNRLGLREGDAVDVPTPRGAARFSIGGVFRDFSSDQGVLVLDWSAFSRWFDGTRVSSVGIYLEPGVEPARARSAVERALGPQRLVSIRTSRDLREEGLHVFDETFRVPGILEIIALVIAVLGVANTLLELTLDRRSEIVTLRFLGLSRARVARMLVFEAGILGAAGTALGLATGAALSWLLVNVINRQSFGWTIDLDPPWARLAASVALLFAATLASALYPAREAARLDLRFEREVL